MTTAEKIQKKKDRIIQLEERREKDRLEIAKLSAEISQLEAFEVTSMMKEYDVPYTEVKSILEELKKRKAPAPEGQQGNSEM